MEDCSGCDFCWVGPDGTLACVLRDEQVRGDSWCRDWQGETRKIEGDRRKSGKAKGKSVSEAGSRRHR